ncbi:MAG: AlpA family phage regulatory protein [Nitratireductor sp.]|nr:AlpA family phage regulatory protein [Nitratireductor sp.]
MNTIDPLLTMHEVTAMLRISPASLYRRVADGTLPKPLKLGHLSRWSRSDLLSALEAASGGKQEERA